MKDVGNLDWESGQNTLMRTKTSKGPDHLGLGLGHLGGFLDSTQDRETESCNFQICLFWIS